MSTYVKMIKDSISPDGIRLPTMHCHYPLIIHAELMTHRVFSRNARSSRAVPIAKMIEEVMDDPFIPQHWGANQRGMQASEECRAPVFLPDGVGHMGECTNVEAWLAARDQAVQNARAFADAGYHKQLVNRLLAPFLYIDTLVTATDWANFFVLRLDSAAEPHMRDLAVKIKECMDHSTPGLLQPGEWHLPYIEIGDYQGAVDYLRNRVKTNASIDRVFDVLKKLSVARCARISYAPWDGDGSIEKEMERYQLLVGSDPLHASPAEHQATPDEWLSKHNFGEGTWCCPEQHGNLFGWRQYRKMLSNEAKNDRSL